MGSWEASIKSCKACLSALVRHDLWLGPRFLGTDLILKPKVKEYSKASLSPYEQQSSLIQQLALKLQASSRVDFLILLEHIRICD